jgi:hypothetical protein
MTGIAGCCALAASGHTAAAPPSSVMNARLCISVLVTRSVMAGLVPAIHVFAASTKKDVDDV